MKFLELRMILGQILRYKENLIDSTIYVNGLQDEILNNKIDESFYFPKVDKVLNLEKT